MRLSPKDPEVRSPTIVHTGFGVARFFADEQFALMQTLSAQNDALIELSATSRYALVSTLVAQSETSVGQNDALIEPHRQSKPLTAERASAELPLQGRRGFAHTGLVATPPPTPSHGGGMISLGKGKKKGGGQPP